MEFQGHITDRMSEIEAYLGANLMPHLSDSGNVEELPRVVLHAWVKGRVS